MRNSLTLKLIPVAAYWLVGLTGCATLPDAQRELTTPHTQQIAFEGAHSPVSEVKGDLILDKLAERQATMGALQNHLAQEQTINSASPLVVGNKVLLLQDGPATYQAMFAAIRDANDHIDMESYIIDDDEMGRTFSDLLLAKQLAGVQVNLIYDSVGSINTPQSFFDNLTAGGIHVLAFNPVNPLAKRSAWWRVNHRDHRKLLVVDGRIAITGGINISKDYSRNPFSRHIKKKVHKGFGWRDIDVQIEGPVVAQFQQLFMDTWSRQQGEALDRQINFPPLTAQGEDIVRAIGNVADDPHSPIYLTLISALNHAEHQVHMTIAYFAPDAQLLHAFTAAARRGVEVTLVMPSRSDSNTMLNLGRSYYGALLKAGVKIYERRDAVMHSKTACIDGIWCTVGSTNLDRRSFLHNNEINAVILGDHFAAQMDAMFADDVAESDVVTLEQWHKRPWLQRIEQRLVRLVAYWL